MPHSPFVLAGLGLLILGGFALWGLGLPGAQAAPDEAPDAATEEATEETTENAAQEVPVELGAVAWRRDFDAAVQEARAADRPLLVLFQEVPGWGTCRRYGRQVLTHPLLVDAIETLFVPVAIYNNSKGDADAATRQAFEEPAWNNPVVRIVDADAKDLVPRLANDWSSRGLLAALSAALAKRGDESPAWLSLWTREEASRASGVETAVFGMTWFWVGEVSLASIDGVVATRAGWLERSEVVEVLFDPKVISYEQLVKQAAERECAGRVFTRSAAQQETAERLVKERAVRSDGAIRTDDDKYFLARIMLGCVPMTPLQAARVNAIIRHKGDATPLLAPVQLALWREIQERPDADWKSAVGVELCEAWARIDASVKSAESAESAE